MPSKQFTVLENNPEVMNTLARELGLSTDSAAFYDVFSLTEPDLRALVPRPVYALLVTMPRTQSWNNMRNEEDALENDYEGFGDDEPVIWFKQTIDCACGSIGLIHSLLNSKAADYITPDSELSRIRRDALPKKMLERARVLEESEALEKAHQAAAHLGQSEEPPPGIEWEINHFVAFVRGRDGHLWELEGSRKGPIDRGLLADDEDAFSDRALDLGLRRVMNVAKGDKDGALRFSCTALAKVN